MKQFVLTSLVVLLFLCLTTTVGCKRFSDVPITHFAPGDVVQLKSGGPKMVVYEVTFCGRNVWCEWWVNHGMFYCHELKKVEESGQ
jgi:uncharacterized protein YodC (DUF2158 family)